MISLLPPEWPARLVEGLLGATTAAVVDWTGVFPTLRKLIVGGICSMFLSPLAVPLLGWVIKGLNIPNDNVQSERLSGFLMGMIGIIVIEIILKAFHLRRDRMGK